jgi:5-methylcytosine-specific restriction enzyme A
MPFDATVEPVNLREIEEVLVYRVQTSLKDSEAARRDRLAVASKIPRRVARLVYVYERNADVVAEVLNRAQGVCERCATGAPFSRRTDGTPYLEVHHTVPLAEQGEDTVENAVALCPNCHRYRHHGIEA